MAGSDWRHRPFQRQDWGVFHPEGVWCCEICRDAEEVRVGGDRVQDATMSQTRHQEAQDARDANLTSLALGCMVDPCDAT